MLPECTGLRINIKELARAWFGVNRALPSRAKLRADVRVPTCMMLKSGKGVPETIAPQIEHEKPMRRLVRTRGPKPMTASRSKGSAGPRQPRLCTDEVNPNWVQA